MHTADHTDKPTTKTHVENITPQSHDAALNATMPGGFRVIRRNGKVTGFDAEKITVAITKAFLAVEGGQAAASSRIHEIVAALTQQITAAVTRNMSGGGTVHIEDLQDQVELALMRTGEHKVAREYVLYREARALERNTKKTVQPKSNINVTQADGTTLPLDEARLSTIIYEACQGLNEVDPELILHDTLRNLYDGIAEKEVGQALMMCSRTMIEKDPNYSYVTARLLLDSMRTEALTFLGEPRTKTTCEEMKNCYADCFTDFIHRGIELELLDPRLQQFDLERLGATIDADRDLQFAYLGLQTLYDRYFIHHQETRFELPQVFFMRVAMGLSLNEVDQNDRAIEFYNLLSSFDFMSSTPTLFNSGTLRSQLSSCYLTTIPDDLYGIYDAIRDNAMLSKYAGGLGNDWTRVRSLGAYIKGTNGKSQGVVPFLKVANDTAVAVNQGGKRKGAVCAYLETWHMDIEEFLDLRKNTGDDRRRTPDMNTANWIPDLFMKRVHEDEQWTLFSPEDVPDLHEKFGKDFEQAYLHHEHLAERGEITHCKKIAAVDLWRKMLTMLFETGHPWITFKDPCNLRSPQQHVGIIHSSNLCTEITLNTSDKEIAVCNLGSVNLPAHVDENGLNTEKLKKTIRTAIRMLDNVIDINYYAVPQARNSNLKHRPIGLGIMGFQDCLYKLRLPYNSDEAVEFADRSMETVSYYAIQASSELAEERGSYSSYAGSLWSKGILPLDSIEALSENRGGYLEMNRSSTLDWDALRTRVMSVGIRNSNTLAIAPTATISNICGVSQSIEPTYQNLYVKSNLSGEFTVSNTYLVHDLKKLGLWDEVMINDLKYFNGSVANIERIPDDCKELYRCAFEIDAKWLIEAGSRRQKWIDQSQSLNLYLAEPSGKKLSELYKLAWLRGLKTTYYLRTMGATHAEKSTVEDTSLNAVPLGVPATEALAACSIDDPDCDACQ